MQARQAHTELRRVAARPLVSGDMLCGCSSLWSAHPGADCCGRLVSGACPRSCQCKPAMKQACCQQMGTTMISLEFQTAHTHGLEKISPAHPDLASFRKPLPCACARLHRALCPGPQHQAQHTVGVWVKNPVILLHSEALERAWVFMSEQFVCQTTT